MNSRKLQESIADDANLSLEKVDKIMETMVNVMLDQLKEGTSVSFQGFGAFEVRKRAKTVGESIDKETYHNTSKTSPCVQNWKHIQGQDKRSATQ